MMPTNSQSQDRLVHLCEVFLDQQYGADKSLVAERMAVFVRSQQQRAVLEGQIAQLQSLYEGGYIGEWDYARINLKLTTELEAQLQNNKEGKL